MSLFIIFLVMKLISAQLIPPVLDPVLDNPFSEFDEDLQNIEVNKIEYKSDNPTADLLKYNAGLTNKDKYLNVTQLIEKNGYPAETYEVRTPDGYLLTLVRIPAAGPPVLVMHGLFSSADEFVTSGPDEALAYTLADAGYDVFLGNARGNKYSRKHITLSPEEDRFWDFSWHEMGIFDLPSIIDFILELVNQLKVYYVGHSQGTTISYVFLSEKPEYNDKINVVVSLSPIAWMSHLKSPALRVLSPHTDEVEFLARAIGLNEVAPDNEFVAVLRDALCGTSVMAAAVCSTGIFLIIGFDYTNANYTDLPVQIAHVPAGSATKQVIHYGQEVNSGKFQQFDYGEEGNIEKYGTPTPPEYDVAKITAKVALFYSTNDWVSSPIDVNKLAEKLPNLLLLYKTPIPYCHTDYIWAKNAKEFIYSKILELFEEN